jgi:phage gp36-like protein
MAYPYATIDDVFARYAPIHTMVGTGNNDVASLEVSSIFIADAQSFVDAHLAKRYNTPVEAEPLITMIVTDISISNMLFEKLGELPNFMQPRYERSIDMLNKLASGDLILTSGSTTLVTTGDQYAWSTTQSYHAIFSPVLDELDQSADDTWIADDQDTRVGS